MNRKAGLLAACTLVLAGCNQSPTSTTNACIARPPDDRIALAVAQGLGGQAGDATVLGVARDSSCFEYAILYTSTVRVVQAFGPAKTAAGVAVLYNTDNGQWFVAGFGAPIAVSFPRPKEG